MKSGVVAHVETHVGIRQGEEMDPLSLGGSDSAHARFLDACAFVLELLEGGRVVDHVLCPAGFRSLRFCTELFVAGDRRWMGTRSIGNKDAGFALSVGERVKGWMNGVWLDIAFCLFVDG